ncbi:MAG: epoxyqueuosine reductase [Bacillota bacterium]
MPDLDAVIEIVNSVYNNENENRLHDGSVIFEKPLYGIADANDSLFEKFENEAIIGSSYYPPEYWLQEAKSVITYFLPFTLSVRRSNYGAPPPSEEWLHGRFLGENFNIKLRLKLVAELKAAGGMAVAPLLHEDYSADYNHFTSSWSERHAAYVAGLGSFGLHRGLITSKGVAGRIGSVITNLRFKPTVRSEGFYYNNCPFLMNKKCGACIKRCPAGAIKETGKDKKKCYQYMFIDDHMHSSRKKFGYKHSICGKCQVNVPCEDKIPSS